MSKKPAESDIAYSDFHYVDCDPIGTETPAEASARIAAKLESGVVPEPAFNYSSGNGRVLLWPVKHPVKLTDPDEIAGQKAINVGLAQALGGKAEGFDHCHNLDRLLRLAGTPNLPDARKRAKGRKIEMAGDVRHNPDAVHDEDAFPIASPSIVSAPTAEIGPVDYIDDLDDLPETVPDDVKALIEDGDTEGKYVSRSEPQFRVMCKLLKDGVAPETVAGVLLNPAWAIGERIREKAGDPEHHARKEVARAMARVAKEKRDDFAALDEEPVSENLGGDAAKRPKKASRFTAVPLSTLRSLPMPKYLVDGLISEGSLFELYGKEKSGKTWCALDMALSIATEIDFHGLATTQGRVLYVIGEGNRRRFGFRIEGWMKARAIGRQMDAATRKQLEEDVESNFRVLALPMHCDVAAQVKEFLEANPGKWSLIVIDTLMRNMGGHISDPKDMALFVHGCDCMREHTGGAVLVLHHEGKDKTKGGMGSTNLAAAVDGILYFARRGKHQRVLSVSVLRDGSDDMPKMVFELERVALKITMDEDGEDIDSAALKLVGKEVGGDGDDTDTEADEEAKQEALRLIRAGGPWRVRVDSGEEWIGHPIAKAYGLDPGNPEDQRRIGEYVESWLKSGELYKGTAPDRHRNTRPALFAEQDFDFG